MPQHACQNDPVFFNMIDPKTKTELQRVRIGISSCLLGERVRYDGGHKRDSFLADIFGRYVEWVAVCPEFEMGLGVPRESLRLVNEHGPVQLIAPNSGLDHTDLMTTYAEKRLTELETQQLCGYVLKRGSPSCGMERVRSIARSSCCKNPAAACLPKIYFDASPVFLLRKKGASMT
jgi:uncharacterized protein YbbK (DUF523 family)